LWVSGNTQTVSATNSEITNNLITLNAGASTPNPYGASIDVARGTGNSNAAIIWNETLQVWQLTEVTPGTSTYITANIATGSTTAGLLSNISQDTTPSLGGNLNIYNHSIYSNVSGVQIWSVSQPGGGGTGVTVTNSQYGNVELINKTKSLVFSLVFG
jgi:hypothetical protein